MWEIYNGILFIPKKKKEGNDAIYNNLDELWRHSAKWNDSNKEKYYIIIYVWNLKQTNKKTHQTHRNRK